MCTRQRKESEGTSEREETERAYLNPRSLKKGSERNVISKEEYPISISEVNDRYTTTEGLMIGSGKIFHDLSI